MSNIKKLILAATLFLISSCKIYKDWQFTFSQERKKVDSMNQALNVCNGTRKWSDLSSEDFYEQYYKLRANSGEVWERFHKREDLFYNGLGTRGSKTRYKDMIDDCDKAIGNAFAIYSTDKNMGKESEYAKNIGYPSGIFGYQDKNYNVGIINFIVYIYNRSKTDESATLSKTIQKNKWFLIKATNIDRNFQVSGIVQNYVIYRSFTKENQLVQFALVRNKKETYLESSPLIGKYFAVVGTKILRASGRNLELLIIKRVE